MSDVLTIRPKLSPSDEGKLVRMFRNNPTLKVIINWNTSVTIQSETKFITITMGADYERSLQAQISLKGVHTSHVSSGEKFDDNMSQN